jgi:hypothetical protein
MMMANATPIILPQYCIYSPDSHIPGRRNVIITVFKSRSIEGHRL